MTLATDITADVDGLMRRGVEARVFPGAVWAYGDLRSSERGACGLLDSADAARPMRLDTIFDVASLTKILAVWASCGALWERGRLELSHRLADVAPDLADRPLGRVTFHQLLTHTAGLPLRANLRQYGTSRADIEAGVMREALHRSPGEAVEYTDRAALILGFVLERLFDAPLDRIADEHVWRPLELSETRFGPLPSQFNERCAPTEYDPATGRHLKGTVHDFSARLLGGVCGIAGVFATLADLERFLRYVLDPHHADTPPGFGARWIDESLQVHTGALRPSRGLFWLPAPGTDPVADVYVHYGFTGAGMWVSRRQRRWAALLTNKLYFSRDRTALTGIRDAFRRIVFGGQARHRRHSLSS